MWLDSMSQRDTCASTRDFPHPRHVQALGRIERLLGAIVTMAGARAATVRLLHAAEHQLVLAAAVQVPTDFAAQTIQMDASCGACGDVLRSSRSSLSAVPCRCVRALAEEPGGSVGRMLALPLRHDEQVCGVLSLYLREGELLDPQLAGLLTSLCEIVGLALRGSEERDETLVQRLTQERHLLANEVHDALAQNLTSIRMRTALIRDAIDKHDTSRAWGYLGEIDESLNVAQARVRELITHFRTDMDERGLLPALESAIAELSGLSGIRICLDNRIESLELSIDQQQQVFYVVREALTNAVKHSSASQVEVRLRAGRQNYQIEIEDNGIGLEAGGCAGEHGHFGLNIMRERAHCLEGAIDFEPCAAQGTCVRLSFPRVPAHRKAPS